MKTGKQTTRQCWNEDIFTVLRFRPHLLPKMISDSYNNRHISNKVIKLEIRRTYKCLQSDFEVVVVPIIPRAQVGTVGLSEYRVLH